MKISTKTPPFYCQNPTLTDTLGGCRGRGQKGQK